MWIWTCIAFEGQLHDCLKFLIGPSGGALRDHTRTGCRPMLHWTWVYPPCFCGRDVQRKWERNRDEAVANKRYNGNVEQCAGEITWPQYEPIHHLGKTEHFLGLLGRTFNNYGLCIYHQQLCPCKILQTETQDRPPPTVDVHWNLRSNWHLMYCTYHTTACLLESTIWTDFVSAICRASGRHLGGFKCTVRCRLRSRYSQPYLRLVLGFHGIFITFKKIKKSKRSPEGLHLDRGLPEIRFVKHWRAQKRHRQRSPPQAWDV